MVEKAVRTALPELNPFFSEAVWKPGRSKVVCFTDMASIILSEQWYKDRKENFNDEKVRITTAPQIQSKMKKYANDTKPMFIG